MTEVVEKTETGLPELPEGLFWRIGEIPTTYKDGSTRYGTGGWASTSGGTYPAVQIMEVRDVRKTKKVPVYGTRWWNKLCVVDHTEEIWYEREAVAVATRLFTGYATNHAENVPEHAMECGGSGPINGPLTTIHYAYHVNADGARAIAADMIEGYHRSVQHAESWRIAEEAKRTAREKIYGDYPPKTLEKA